MPSLRNFLNSEGIHFDATKTKIHLACYNGFEHPIDVYYAGNFKAWQQEQTKRNFGCSHVLSLIDLGNSEWLFVGVYDVLGCTPKSTDNRFYLYDTVLRPGQDEWIGRVIVHHQRTRQSYIWLREEVALPIIEIRREPMTIGDFPGYNSVRLDFATLHTIITQKIPSWHGALSDIKGIYLIVDTSTGEQYVGKASGNEGLWQRWSDYANSGHGGNKKLIQLLQDKGTEHKQHFQYTILEIADTHASDDEILKRESHWMKVLGTRVHGLN